jgi:hypothetical protein
MLDNLTEKERSNGSEIRFAPEAERPAELEGKTETTTSSEGRNATELRRADEPEREMDLDMKRETASLCEFK